jgi:hypothetical protein
MTAIQNSREFNVIHSEGGVKIDFIIARQDAWGREQLQRRRRRELLTGITAFTAAPEDVMLAKLLYYQEGGSEKHLRDIAGMFKWSADEIDVQYFEKWARELGVSVEWDAVRSRLSQS